MGDECLKCLPSKRISKERPLEVLFSSGADSKPHFPTRKVEDHISLAAVKAPQSNFSSISSKCKHPNFSSSII
jgi:hypothetical protein